MISTACRLSLFFYASSFKRVNYGSSFNLANACTTVSGKLIFSFTNTLKIENISKVLVWCCLGECGHTLIYSLVHWNPANLCENWLFQTVGKTAAISSLLPRSDFRPRPRPNWHKAAILEDAISLWQSYNLIVVWETCYRPITQLYNIWPKESHLHDCNIELVWWISSDAFHQCAQPHLDKSSWALRYWS